MPTDTPTPNDDLFAPPPAPAPGNDDGGLSLAHYAQRAYLEYALSVVKGRALPDVAELHIGHALIGHAVFVGLRQAIADFKAEAIQVRRPSAV